MGAWSVDVFGSDDAMDFLDEISDTIGVDVLDDGPEDR